MKRRTFPTSLLTDSEREAGWYKCTDRDCADAKRANLGRGVPHIHHDTKEKS